MADIVEQPRIPRQIVGVAPLSEHYDHQTEKGKGIFVVKYKIEGSDKVFQMTVQAVDALDAFNSFADEYNRASQQDSEGWTTIKG